MITKDLYPGDEVRDRYDECYLIEGIEGGEVYFTDGSVISLIEVMKEWSLVTEEIEPSDFQIFN
jgi:hypothetical protein